ncbi:MAG: hypothetical protein HQK58_14225 [Deltaproteobacteria bacterium]|nr:hypothetical protein [Deltaproteobacteria bacterium]
MVKRITESVCLLVIALFVVTCLAGGASAQSSSRKKSSSKATATPTPTSERDGEGDQRREKSSSSASDGESSGGHPGSYFEFGDILLPSKMDIDRKNSFVYETGRVKTGYLTLTGNVPSEELVDFFKFNMVKDGWRLRCIFKYSKNLLLFSKDGKSCVVNIMPQVGISSTVVEILLSPDVGS